MISIFLGWVDTPELSALNGKLFSLVPFLIFSSGALLNSKSAIGMPSTAGSLDSAQQQLVATYDEFVLSGDLNGAIEVLNKLEAIGLNLFVQLEVAKLLTLSNRQDEGYRLAMAAVNQSTLPTEDKENLLSIFDPSRSKIISLDFGLSGTSARNPLSKTDEKTALVAGEPVKVLNHSDNSYSSGYSLSVVAQSPRAERFGYLPSFSVVYEKFPSDNWSKATFAAGFGKRLNFKLGLNSITPSFHLEMQQTNSKTTRDTAKLSVYANQYHSAELSTYQRLSAAQDSFENASHMDASRNEAELGIRLQKTFGTKVAARRVWSNAEDISSSYETKGVDLSISKRSAVGDVELTHSYDHTLYKGPHFFFGTPREQRITTWAIQFSPKIEALGRLKPFLRLYAKTSKSNQFSYSYSDDGLVFGTKF